jgi:hypothetical protein
MAEFLIKAVNTEETTLQIYRNLINNKWVPEAQAFPYSKADLISAMDDGKRYREYRWALNHPNKPMAQTIINEYEANPLSQQRIVQLKNIIKKKNHIDHNFRVMVVERHRTDADITTWLAKRHKAGNSIRGDIITVRDNGWTWGGELHPLTATRFKPPRFFIVKAPQIAFAQAEKYMQPEEEDYIDPEKPGTSRRPLTFRRWHLLVGNLPQSIKNKIRDEGEVTVTPNQIKPFIRDKVTEQTEG